MIPGISDDCAFIQLITDEGAFRVDYGREQFVKGADVCIADSRFSLDGITLKMDTDGVKAEGEIAYSELTPVRSDAMGFFRFFPMQCRHGVLSLHHRLMGSLTINGRKYDFSEPDISKRTADDPFPEIMCGYRAMTLRKSVRSWCQPRIFPFWDFHLPA